VAHIRTFPEKEKINEDPEDTHWKRELISKLKILKKKLKKDLTIFHPQI